MSKNHQAWLALLAVVSLSLLLSGVAAAGSLPMKACELVTAKDVESVLGAGFAPKEVLNNNIMSSCGYAKNKLDVVGVTLKREFLSAAQELQMEQDGIKQQGVQVTPVSGLGEGAYYFVDPKNNFQLNFGKGNLRVILAVESGGKPNIDAALKLAKMAYPRLK
jgi:hypothetical protein